MLSRVAESLYWMARYIERAEAVARLAAVDFQALPRRHAARPPGRRRAHHQRRRPLPQRVSRRRRARRARVPPLPSRQPQRRARLPLARARERARRARADQQRDVGAPEPPVPAGPRRPGRRDGRRALRLLPPGPRRLAGLRGHHRGHDDARRGLRVHPARPVPRARRHHHPHPRRALRGRVHAGGRQRGGEPGADHAAEVVRRLRAVPAAASRAAPRGRGGGVPAAQPAVPARRALLPGADRARCLWAVAPPAVRAEEKLDPPARLLGRLRADLDYLDVSEVLDAGLSPLLEDILRPRAPGRERGHQDVLQHARHPARARAGRGRRSSSSSNSSRRDA